MNSIGKNISERRREAGITQEQLADKLGISAQAVSKWENDLSEPDASTLLSLSKIFGVTVDDLLNGMRAPMVSKEEEKPENRMIVINVQQYDNRVTLRIPAELGAQADFSFLNSVIEENAGEEAVIAINALENYKKNLRMMLDNNVVGTIVDAGNAEGHVTISIE